MICHRDLIQRDIITGYRSRCDKVVGGGLTGIWKTRFFMTAYETVLQIGNSAEKGVKPVWAHDLKQGTEFWCVVFCQCARVHDIYQLSS